MRVWLAILIAGCSGGSEPATTVSPAPSAPAPPALVSHPDAAVVVEKVTTACIPPDFVGTPEWFDVANDRTVYLCIERKMAYPGYPMSTRCLSIDLQTGEHTEATPPRRSDVRVADRFRVTDTKQKVEVCFPRGRCTKLAVKPLPDVPEEPRESYEVDVSADNLRAVATQPATAADPSRPVMVFDAQTGAKLATLTVGDATYGCPRTARFIGNSIYVPSTVCKGERGIAHVFTGSGKKLGTVDGLNTFLNDPYPLDEGRRWAVAGYGGMGLLVFDATTGKTTSLISTTPKLPEECEDCGAIYTTGPGNFLTISASGRLYQFAAGVVVYDEAITKIEKHVPLRICSDPGGPPPPWKKPK